MEDINSLDPQYLKIIEENPEKKFVLYIRFHPDDHNEEEFIQELTNIYGKCRKMMEERLVIFITSGNNVKGFVEKLNSSGTSMYLSFIQSEDELLQSK